MAEVNWDKSKRRLAEIIVKKLKAEFSSIHLSGNLASTIKISKYSDNENSGYEIEIPAEMYDIAKFRKDGVIIHTGKGSYASEVNVSGGFSGQHKNYVENSIQQAISEWLGESQLKAKIK